MYIFFESKTSFYFCPITIYFILLDLLAYFISMATFHSFCLLAQLIANRRNEVTFGTKPLHKVRLNVQMYTRICTFVYCKNLLELLSQLNNGGPRISTCLFCCFDSRKFYLSDHDDILNYVIAN